MSQAKDHEQRLAALEAHDDDTRTVIEVLYNRVCALESQAGGGSNKAASAPAEDLCECKHRHSAYLADERRALIARVRKKVAVRRLVAGDNFLHIDDVLTILDEESK